MAERRVVVSAPFDDETSVGPAPAALGTTSEEWSPGGGAWHEWQFNPTVDAFVTVDRDPGTSEWAYAAGTTYTLNVQGTKLVYRAKGSTPGVISIRALRWLPRK